MDESYRDHIIYDKSWYQIEPGCHRNTAEKEKEQKIDALGITWHVES